MLVCPNDVISFLSREMYCMEELLSEFFVIDRS